jgi:hypothetical protein
MGFVTRALADNRVLSRSHRATMTFGQTGRKWMPRHEGCLSVGADSVILTPVYF